MKLPDFLLTPSLNALRAGMGIPAGQFGDFNITISPGKLTDDELRKLTSGEGIEVNFDELTILPDGTLAYKDSRVLLYIRDHHIFSGEWQAPKYHFCNCRALDRMRRIGRFERYVVATEITGNFRINVIDGSSRRSDHHKLDVCQNCLDQIGIEGFSLQNSRAARRTYVAEFLPSKFFERFPRSLIVGLPIHTAATAPVNEYPPNWGEISRAARLSANWTCTDCGLALRVHKKKYLHVHHLSGVRSDNRPENLQVLCLGCHAEEPQHQRMKLAPVYKDFLKETGWRPKR